MRIPCIATCATPGSACSSCREFPSISVRESRNPRASPSGHLEEGESVIDGAIREAGEEVGVAIDPSDLTFVHVVHYRAPGGEGRIGFFFLTEKWAGDPWNREPAKCARLIWSDPAQPPAATVPYTAAALRPIAQGQPFSLGGWPSPPPPEAWVPTTRLDTADAGELAGLLQFVKEWLTADSEARASFARFAGTPGYDAAGLCAGIDRLSFLLGGNDGEHLLA